MRVCPNCGEENPERARFCFACGTPLRHSAAAETRKIVTILFSDVTGSTSLAERLDPESMRRIMSRYYEAARRTVVRHGGTVEKFIGDAVMAIFGVPQVHEDDALRAVRAALQLNDSIASLNDELDAAYGVRLALRTGIDTGEVVVGSGETYATGDVVNVAARLEQTAEPGEILIGDATRRLVRDAVEVEAIEPLALRGKSDPVVAWRLLGIVRAEAIARRLDSPLVGRVPELAVLRAAYEDARDHRRCRLVAVIGNAGIGKSRLVRELVASLEGEALVLTGRCLAYGEGITFWPLAEIVRSAAAIPAEADVDEAVARIAALVRDDPERELVAVRIAGAIGLGEAAAPAEEIAWASRKLMESAARRRPLVLVVDDVHWAEPTFLDLVEGIAARIEDSPVLIICTARPELLDARPEWTEENPAATTLLLDSLTSEDSRQLIENLVRRDLGAELRERIATAADGNPLFVEEMLAMVEAGGNGNGKRHGGIVVPPTIQALLAARIDQLDHAERVVLERASIPGQEFAREAVVELVELAGGVAIDEALQALVRKDLVRPAHGAFTDGEVYRFRHVLIRDAAYAEMPKELRADLHERFARFLVRIAGDRALAYEELLGYHLEQAHRLRRELSPADERAVSLAVEAADCLRIAGTRAYARADMPAAANLLERALALAGPSDPARGELQVLLGLTMRELGRLARAEEVLAAAEEEARAHLQRPVELSAHAARAMLRGQTDPAFDIRGALAGAEAAVPVLEAAGDEAGLARTWRLAFFCRLMLLQFGELEQAARRALEHARRAGDAIVASESLYWLAIAVWWGPRPVAEGARVLEQLLEETRGPSDEAAVLTSLAGLKSMTGEIEEARELIERARERFHELGLVLREHNTALGVAQIDLHAGDPFAAERTLRASCAALEALGETGYLSTQLSFLAFIVALVGDPEEALAIAERSRELTAHGDVLWTTYWCTARAQAYARLGRYDEAVPLVEQAVDLVAQSDDPHTLATIKGEAAAVLLLAGESGRARLLLEEALALHEAKGCVPCAARTRGQLADLAA